MATPVMRMTAISNLKQYIAGTWVHTDERNGLCSNVLPMYAPVIASIMCEFVEQTTGRVVAYALHPVEGTAVLYRQYRADRHNVKTVYGARRMELAKYILHELQKLDCTFL